MQSFAVILFCSSYQTNSKIKLSIVNTNKSNIGIKTKWDQVENIIYARFKYIFRGLFEFSLVKYILLIYVYTIGNCTSLFFFLYIFTFFIFIILLKKILTSQLFRYPTPWSVVYFCCCMISGMSS